MFKNWGAWLGTHKEVKEENCSVVNDELKHDVNKANVKEDADPPQLLQKAKVLSGKSLQQKDIYLKNILAQLSTLNLE